MDLEKIKCVVEIGNSDIKCVIAENNNDSILKIITSSVAKSQGIHNGTVVNSNEAIKAIRSCLSDTEAKANIVLKKINLVLETPEFICTRLSKSRKVDGSKISKDDISFLLNEAKKEVSLNSQKNSIIHIFNHNYIVDGKEFIKEPIDIYADNLSHEMTFLTLPKNTIKNFNQVFVNCDIEIERIISSTFALAVNNLDNTGFKLGATLIDIGYEKTSVGIFKNFALIHSMTFPIGIHHITKDISRLCSLTLSESESIRDHIGCSFEKNKKFLDKENSLSKKFFKDSKFRKISNSFLKEIITARLEEILKIIKKEIYFTGLNLTSGQNILLTGTGSKLPYLEEFCSNYFDINVKSLNFNNSDTWNGALNIIFNGWETEAIPKSVSSSYKKRGFLSRMLGNLA